MADPPPTDILMDGGGRGRVWLARLVHQGGVTSTMPPVVPFAFMIKMKCQDGLMRAIK